MAGYLIVNGPEVGHWAMQRMNGNFFEAGSVAIGLKKEGALIAGVIYDNFNERSIWCHVAIDEQITPSYLAAIFDYPFNVANVEKIIVPVGSDNEKSRHMVLNMGFVEEGRIKEGRPNGDIIFFTMTKKTCRFLTNRYAAKIKV